MSSILRALKKLESTPQHAQETPPLDSKFVPLADTGRQKTPTKILAIVIGSGLVCGLVILAGWWLLPEKTPPPLEPHQIVEQGQVPAPAIPAAPRESAPVQPAAAPVSLPKPATKTALPPQSAAESPQPMPVTTAQPPRPAPEPEAGEILHVEEPAPPVLQEAVPPAPATAAQPPTEKIVAADKDTAKVVPPAPKREIPLLNDPDMKLQAITWSKDPQRRLVVLNNHILHQGEMVNGYHIDAINQDDVVISNKGEKWKLVFRIR